MGYWGFIESVVAEVGGLFPGVDGKNWKRSPFLCNNCGLLVFLAGYSVPPMLISRWLVDTDTCF